VTETRRAQHRARSSAGLQPHHMVIASLSLLGTIPAVWTAAQVAARIDGGTPPGSIGFEEVVDAIFERSGPDGRDRVGRISSGVLGGRRG
jgi:hypothetical protein